MEKEAKIHKHPISGDEIFGKKLEPGDIIEKKDKFDAESGYWIVSSFAGHPVLAHITVIYIRPEEI